MLGFVTVVLRVRVFRVYSTFAPPGWLYLVMVSKDLGFCRV